MVTESKINSLLTVVFIIVGTLAEIDSVVSLA